MGARVIVRVSHMSRSFGDLGGGLVSWSRESLSQMSLRGRDHMGGGLERRWLLSLRLRRLVSGLRVGKRMRELSSVGVDRFLVEGEPTVWRVLSFRRLRLRKRRVRGVFLGGYHLPGLLDGAPGMDLLGNPWAVPRDHRGRRLLRRRVEHRLVLLLGLGRLGGGRLHGRRLLAGDRLHGRRLLARVRSSETLSSELLVVLHLRWGGVDRGRPLLGLLVGDHGGRVGLAGEDLLRLVGGKRVLLFLVGLVLGL
jgi:hypothetical protein